MARSKSRAVASPIEYIQGMDDSGNITQYRQKDINEEVGVASCDVVSKALLFMRSMD